MISSLTLFNGASRVISIRVHFMYKTIALYFNVENSDDEMKMVKIDSMVRKQHILTKIPFLVKYIS